MSLWIDFFVEENKAVVLLLDYVVQHFRIHLKVCFKLDLKLFFLFFNSLLTTKANQNLEQNKKAEYERHNLFVHKTVRFSFPAENTFLKIDKPF